MISQFNAFAVKDNSLHFARIEVANTVSLTRIDNNEPSGRLKWRFILGTGYSTDDGFFEITFYYCGKFNGNLVAELLDDAGIVKWSSGQGGGWISGSVYDKCGQDILDPASRLIDGNILTEWRHSLAEQHWIILDMGSSYAYPSFRTYVDAGANPMYLTIFVSDNPAVWGTPAVIDWDILPGWNEISVTPVHGRYIKIVNSVGGTQTLNKWMEFQARAAYKVVLAMNSATWEFRLRTNANTTSGTDWYAQISNVIVKKYKKSGSAEFTLPVHIENVAAYQTITDIKTLNPGTQVKFQMNFSTDNITWSGWAGPDGTANSYYLGGNTIIPPLGYATAEFYKWKAFLTGDGRNTPILDSLKIMELVTFTRGIVDFIITQYPPDTSDPAMGGNQDIAIKKMDYFTQDYSIYTSGNLETYLPHYNPIPSFTEVTPSINSIMPNALPFTKGLWTDTVNLPLESGMIHIHRHFDIVPSFTCVIPSINSIMPNAILFSRGLWTDTVILPLESGMIHIHRHFDVMPAFTDVIPGIDPDPLLGGNRDIPITLLNWRGMLQENPIEFTTHTSHIPRWIPVDSGWVSRLGNQVLSGYLTDESGIHYIHPDGMNLMVFSEDGKDIRTNAYLDANTGFYQVILGLFKYSSRNLVVKQTSKDWDVAYRSFPTEDIIDATKLLSDRDLAFTIVDLNAGSCPRAVAFVDSLVTY